MSTSTTAITDRHGGPPLLVPAVAFSALTVAGAVLGGAGPRPASTPEEVLAYAAANGPVMGAGAALLLGSAFPLVVFAATLVRRMQRLGVTAPGPLMGLAGAVLAAASISVSALVAWTAAQTAPLGDPALARMLATLGFATGGVGFVAPLGLLLLGIAVPALVTGLMSRALGWVAAVVGGLALLSTFALVSDVLYPLLPVGRFGGVLVVLAAAVLLPVRRTSTGGAR
jgi:hypothetical protein